MTSVNATNSTTPTGPTGSTGTSGSSAASGSNLDQDTFLKLLVAQLKYQDPSSPSDPTQFMAETAQFTVVQKLDALSTLDQQVLDATKAQTAASLIGKSVTYTDLAGGSHTGIVTGTTYGSQNPTLTVGGQQVALDTVTAVGTVAPAAATGGGTTKTTG
jgi:flagellar basal-body rod modification protein FlgD